MSRSQPSTAVSAFGCLNNRLDRLSDYPFTRLTALLGPAQPPAGQSLVVMSVGEPQHPPPPVLESTLRTQGHLWGKYPPLEGTPAFRASVAGWLSRRYHLPEGALDSDRMVLPVAGTREALFQVALLTVPERKHGQVPAVLMPNPFYAVYEGAACMAGAEPVFLPAARATGFLPDLDALSPDLLQRTALFYLCSPANPQGAVADAAYLRQALELARTHQFVLVLDECYAEIYHDAPPAGGLEVAWTLDSAGKAGWADNLLVFHSLSKRSNAAGLRSGFVAGDPRLIAAFRRLRSYGAAGTPLPLLAAATALWNDEAHVVENRRLYRLKFAAAAAELGRHPGFYRPEGGFCLWLEVGDGEAVALRLWREAGIRTLPGAYLARPDTHGRNPGAAFLRIALVHDEATIRDACRRIAALL